MIETQLLEMITSSEKVVGTKQVIKNIENASIKCVVVADDADGFIKEQVFVCAKEYGVKVATVPSKAKLGKACGIEVAAAVVGLR
jgi:Ribosomal protein HS6-type (S12/L30/L7a)